MTSETHTQHQQPSFTRAMAVEEEKRGAGTKHVTERSLSLSPSSLTKILSDRSTTRDNLKWSNIAQYRKEQFANAKLNHQRAVWTIDLPG